MAPENNSIKFAEFTEHFAFSLGSIAAKPHKYNGMD